MNQEIEITPQSAPESVSFYFSKSKLVMNYFYYFISFCFFIYYIRTTHAINFTVLKSNVLQLVAIILIIFPSIVFLKKYFNSGIQLKISNEGVWLKEFGFYKWDDIVKTSIIAGAVESLISSRYLNLYLVNNNIISVDISNIKDSNKIIDMIDMYNKKEPTEQELKDKIREHKSIKIFLAFIALVILFTGVTFYLR